MIVNFIFPATLQNIVPEIFFVDNLQRFLATTFVPEEVKNKNCNNFKF